MKEFAINLRWNPGQHSILLASVLALPWCGVVTNTASAQSSCQEGVLASGEGLSDFYGAACAIGGDRILVGAPRDDEGATDAGAVYVYRPELTGEWVLEDKLLSDAPEVSATFGASLSLDGTVAVIGSPTASSNGTASGEVGVWTRVGVAWTEEQTLTASDAAGFAFFGNAVDISGDTIVVGASGAGASGAAYVFRRMGDDFVEVAALTPSAGGAEFGDSVTIDGDRVVVVSNPVIYIFERDAGDPEAWGEVLHFDEPGSAVRVSLDRDRLLIGNSDALLGDGRGAIRERDAGGFGLWGEVAELALPVAALDDDLGTAVVLQGDRALLSAPRPFGEAGVIAVFDRMGPTDWALRRCLDSGTDALDEYGSSLDYDGDRAVTGFIITDTDGERREARPYLVAACIDCPGDVDTDGMVGVSDLLGILANWGPCEIAGACAGDRDCDRAVGVSDLLVVLSGWGACP